MINGLKFCVWTKDNYVVSTVANPCPKCNLENSLVWIPLKFYTKSIKMKIKCVRCDYEHTKSVSRIRKKDE